jgi:hypothetical protein
MPDEFSFDPEEMLRVLGAHDVRFVLIGGYGAVLHGSAAFTTDADICPERSPENLRRLAAALRDMDARIRASGAPTGLELVCDEQFLGQMAMVNLITRYGAFDISFNPAGTNGYEDLARGAVEYEIAGTRVRVASLGDIIRSKEAADRPKDRQLLPHLRALQDEIARREQPA